MNRFVNDLNLLSDLVGWQSSTQTALGNALASRRRYGMICCSCWQPLSRKYKPSAIIASCALLSRQNTPAAFSCGQYRYSVCTYSSFIKSKSNGKKMVSHRVLFKVEYLSGNIEMRHDSTSPARTLVQGVGLMRARTRARLCTVR